MRTRKLNDWMRDVKTRQVKDDGGRGGVSKRGGGVSGRTTTE